MNNIYFKYCINYICKLTLQIVFLIFRHFLLTSCLVSLDHNFVCLAIWPTKRLNWLISISFSTFQFFPCLDYKSYIIFNTCLFGTNICRSIIHLMTIVFIETLENISCKSIQLYTGKTQEMKKCLGK